jgi:catechol 2,3-dioxygenase-like lactoylglutathione lyase family enzyme
VRRSESFPSTRPFYRPPRWPTMVLPRVSLNHVVIYVRDVESAMRFYHGKLGFKVIESMQGYARLKSPAGGATIALHVSKDRKPPPGTRQVVLYFETRDLSNLCRSLRRKQVRFDQFPYRMPWGWDHAYLRDPDGHQISLYWAGRKRFLKTPPMRAA